MRLPTLLAFGLALLTGCHNKVIEKPTAMLESDRPTLYHFQVEDIEGNPFDFSSLEGRKILIVNTASQCGLTPQYKELQALHQRYEDSGLTIVGFPANDFMSQEPGSNDEIAAFCEKNYGVTFPMMAKITVTGDDMHPLYQFLTRESENGFADSKVAWNFQKYLINRQGQLEKVVGPRVTPDDVAIVSWIEEK